MRGCSQPSEPEDSHVGHDVGARQNERSDGINPRHRYKLIGNSAQIIVINLYLVRALQLNGFIVQFVSFSMGNNDQGNGETDLQKTETGVEKAKEMQIVSSDGRSVAEQLEGGHGGHKI